MSSSLPQSSVDKVKKIGGSNKDTNEDDGLLITLADEKDAINGETYYGMLSLTIKTKKSQHNFQTHNFYSGYLHAKWKNFF